MSVALGILSCVLLWITVGYLIQTCRFYWRRHRLEANTEIAKRLDEVVADMANIDLSGMITGVDRAQEFIAKQNRNIAASMGIPPQLFISQSLPPIEHTIVSGYRQWEIDWKSHPAFLVGAYGQKWPSAEMGAKCLGPASYQVWNDPGKPKPSTAVRAHLATNQCTCGIYATRDLATRDLRTGNSSSAKYLLADRDDDGRVISRLGVSGAVTLSGVVIEGDRGYRAEHAKIEKLWIVGVISETDHDKYMSGLLEDLQELYDVPVSMEHMLVLPDLVRPYSGRIDPRPEDAEKKEFPADPYFVSGHSYKSGTGPIVHVTSTNTPEQCASSSSAQWKRHNERSDYPVSDF